MKVIKKNPGIKAEEASVSLDNRPIKTIERQIKNLTDKKLIKRVGSKKSGGYFIKK
ncbi:MAG: hypothetical protein ABIA04_03265 [Pseudomonadota bacterium]